MFRVAVCDDEPAICLQVKLLVQWIGVDLAVEMVVSTFHSAEDFCRAWERGEEFDLIFLDICLKTETMNGVSLGSWLRFKKNNQRIQIVYMSARTDYAMELFKNRPLDFLVKPLNYEKLFPVMELALRLQAEEDLVFSYYANRTLYRVPLKSILYFESQGRKISLYSRPKVHNGSFYSSMYELERQLRKRGFFLINKSCLVNFFQVKSFSYDKVVLLSGKSLTISQSRREAVEQYRKFITRVE